MRISDNLLCLFNTRVEERDGSYVIEVPRHEVAAGDVDADGAYRVAVLSQAAQTPTAGPKPAPEREREGTEPPIQEGAVVDVEIESLGDQGDGIARVGPGYVVIVPDTEVGERVSIEITEARENVAFAEVIENYDRPV